MVDVFIAPNRKVWVLDMVPLKEAKKPTPGEWSELSLASKQSAPATAMSSNSGAAKNNTNHNTIDTSATMLASGTTSALPSPLLPHTPLPNEVRSMNLVYSNKSISKNNLECVSADNNTAQMRAVMVSERSDSINNKTSNLPPAPPTSSVSDTRSYGTGSASNNTYPNSGMSDRKGISLHVDVPMSPQAQQQQNQVNSQLSPAARVAANIATPTKMPSSSTTTSDKTSTAATTSSTTTNIPESPLSVDLDGDSAHTIPPYLMEKYKLGPVLGKGAYANVREGTDKETGKQVAVKILHRGSVKSSAEVSVRREVHILSMLSHPNIVRTYAFYEEPEYFYTVLECIHGGALFDRVKTKALFTESTVRELAYVLLSAIKHCHDHHVVHR